MASPKEIDVLAWLKREEIDIHDRLAIRRLQLALAGARNRSQKSYYQHMLNMAAYEINVLEPLGVTAHVNPDNIYRPVGFGIKGESGFFSWNTVKEKFDLRGPRKTGEFD